MARLAVAAGHPLLGIDLERYGRRRDVATPWGAAAVVEAADHLLLQRHGVDRYVAPHAIEHRANLYALAELGADRVMAIGSVGSLHPEIEVGALVAPDDFVALHLGLTYSDGASGHRVGGLDPEWRRRVIEAWAGPAAEPPRDGGTYWQAIGPRFETPAEIRLIAPHADVIGMTIASECVLAGELGLAYAAVCVVDNLANGIGAAPLTLAEYEAGRSRNRERVRAALEAVVPSLAEPG
jgi:5'-methylthioadenosine phosphorylase